jgi:hypothetical protein
MAAEHEWPLCDGRAKAVNAPKSHKKIVQREKIGGRH